MTFDLAQALRDAVERTDEPAVPTALPGTTPVGASVGRLVARVRRRRVARNTARGVVGVGAAGTLALVGTQVVGGRGAGDLRETAASSTDGAAAACGEPVSVVTGADPGLRLARSLVTTDSPLWSSTGAATQADQDDLGKLEGRTLDVYAVGHSSDAVTAPATPPAVTAAGSTATYTVVPDPGVEGLSVVVARDGLVVGASDAATTAVTDSTVLLADVSTGTVTTAVGLSVPLVSCADGSGEALPAGNYTTYVVDPNTGAASSPYRLSLLPHDDGQLADLPSGFPADVPVVDGTLLRSEQLSASSWTLVVQVAGTDGLTRATHLLDGEGSFFPTSGGDADEFTTYLGKTVVHVRESVTTAGARTLTYRVTQP